MNSTASENGRCVWAAVLNKKQRAEPKVRRLAARGEWIRKFSSAMTRHRHQRGRLHSAVNDDSSKRATALSVCRGRRLLGRYRRADGRPAPTRPKSRNRYLSRAACFESISLGITDHPSGMLLWTHTVGVVPNEQQLVLASLDRAQARVVPTRSGQRQQLSLGWEGRKPLDTE